MAPLPTSTSAASAALRTCTSHRLAAIAPTPFTCLQQRRGQSQASYTSPFERIDTTKTPTWGKYASKRPELSNRMFQYFLAGTFGGLAAVGAKSTVQGEFYGSSIVAMGTADDREW